LRFAGEKRGGGKTHRPFLLTSIRRGFGKGKRGRTDAGGGGEGAVPSIRFRGDKRQTDVKKRGTLSLKNLQPKEGSRKGASNLSLPLC